MKIGYVLCCWLCSTVDLHLSLNSLLVCCKILYFFKPLRLLCVAYFDFRLDTCLALAAEGYVFGRPYDWFLSRYKMLSHRTWPSWLGSPRDAVMCLLRDLSIPNHEYALGRSMVFIRAYNIVSYKENKSIVGNESLVNNSFVKEGRGVVVTSTMGQ